MQNLLAAADSAYWNGSPILSDLAYDTLREALNAPANIGPAAPRPAETRAHWPMLSLQKAEGPALSIFIAQENSRELIIEPKVDGLAIELHYQNGKLQHACTRGDGHGGIDLTDLISLSPHATTKTTEPITVHAELYLADTALRRISRARRQYTSPRAAIGSIINAANREEYAAELSIAVHDVLPIPGETDIRQAYERAHRAGLPTLPHLATPANRITRQTMRTFFTSAIADYPADGIVLKSPDLARRRSLGATATAPKWALAIKDYALA